MEEKRADPPHIALLCTPGVGHLIPLAALAERLVNHHQFSVTLIAQLTCLPSHAQKSIVHALPKEVNIVALPEIPFDTIPNNAKPTRIFLSITHNLPFLRDLLKSLASTTPLVALVVDIFGTEAFDVAREVGVPPYLFIPMSCTSLSLVLYLPTLDAKIQGEYRDLAEPVRLPGCVPLHGRDLPDPLQDRRGEAYAGVLRLMKRYHEASGILVNSFEELEAGVVKGFKTDSSLPPIYPVGPLLWTGPIDDPDGSECLRWLDMQPDGSVLYVCFGGGGTLTSQQTRELAWGLEMSGQRFLWVVKSPHDYETSATNFGGENGKQPLEFLPEGFMERTRSFGLLIPNWASQMQVLSHRSTGGFLTHCGWNSTLESIMKGVPLIAWPLYAEQRMNAVLLVEELKVGLRPEVDKSGVVGREEISRLVKCLMEGEEGKRVRSRTQEFRDVAALAIGKDGSSFKSLSKVARHWKDLKREDFLVPNGHV